MSVYLFRIADVKAPTKQSVKAALEGLETKRVLRPGITNLFTTKAFSELPRIPAGDLHDRYLGHKAVSNGFGFKVPDSDMGRSPENPAQSIRIWIKQTFPYVDPASFGTFTPDD